MIPCCFIYESREVMKPPVNKAKRDAAPGRKEIKELMGQRCIKQAGSSSSNGFLSLWAVFFLNEMAIVFEV